MYSIARRNRHERMNRKGTGTGTPGGCIALRRVLLLRCDDGRLAGFSPIARRTTSSSVHRGDKTRERGRSRSSEVCLRPSRLHYVALGNRTDTNTNTDAGRPGVLRYGQRRRCNARRRRRRASFTRQRPTIVNHKTHESTNQRMRAPPSNRESIDIYIYLYILRYGLKDFPCACSP